MNSRLVLSVDIALDIIMCLFHQALQTYTLAILTQASSIGLVHIIDRASRYISAAS